MKMEKMNEQDIRQVSGGMDYDGECPEFDAVDPNNGDLTCTNCKNWVKKGDYNGGYGMVCRKIRAVG